MNCKHVAIPSVIERDNQSLMPVSSAPESRIQLYETGVGYLVGGLALSQGKAPYRNINSSPSELDYQLLAKAALLIASGGNSGELVLTTGFPYTTYELFKQQATDFYTPKDIFITYNADNINERAHKRIQLTIKHLEIMPEILGCVNALRKGPLNVKGNFFIVSLGYGTCETALSLESGLVGRTCMSVPGLRHSVNNLYSELSRNYNLSMKNEHMINQSFQNGNVVIERKRKDLTELRRNHLANYYDEVISPSLKKAFSDSDFEKADRIYLVGGGVNYADLVDCFKAEFDGVLEVVVPPDAGNMASLGYYLRSLQWSGPHNAAQAVGLDLGNAYTVVCQHQAVHKNEETHQEVEQTITF